MTHKEYNKITFNGYIIRFKSKAEKPLNNLLSSLTAINWESSLISEELLMYHIKPVNLVEFGLKAIWDNYHNLTDSCQFLYVENLFSNSEVPAPLSIKPGCDLTEATKEKYTWHHNKINLPNAQNYAKTLGKKYSGEGITVAVLDTGHRNHNAISTPNLLKSKGWNYVEGNRDSYDITKPGILNNPGHGTSVISLIIGNDKLKHSVGIALNTNIIPIRMTDTVVNADIVRWLKSIDYAIYSGANITSSSLRAGSLIPNPPPEEMRSINDILKLSISKGLISFAAAGQGGDSVPSLDIWPAASPFITSCASSTINDIPWSRYGFKSRLTDIAAPGAEVYVADSEFGETMKVYRYCGTSFSTALMAGAAAIWYSFWTKEMLHKVYGKGNIFYLFRLILQKYGTRKDVKDWDTINFGKGIIDLERLLRMDGNELPTLLQVEEFKKTFNTSNIKSPKDTILDWFPNTTLNELDRALSLIFDTANLTESILTELKFHLCTNETTFLIFAKILKNENSTINIQIFKNTISENASNNLVNIIN